MLKDLIRKEISSPDLVDIRKDLVDSVNKEVSDLISWCANSPVLEACNDLERLLMKAFRSLGRVRLIKYLERGGNKDNVDAQILETIEKIVENYYHIVLSGLATPELEVPVVVKKPLDIKGRIVDKGEALYLNVIQAVLLELGGYVDILRP